MSGGIIMNIGKKIEVENIANIIDLGGIQTAEGESIKAGKLFRSATLSRAEHEVVEAFLKEQNIKTVIDLRSEKEIQAMPNHIIKGVATIWNPIFMGKIQGLDFQPALGVSSIQEYMEMVYRRFVNNQIIQKQLKQFFSILQNNRDGAILWHCSEGRDRTGICTALLLAALGVKKEDIIENYKESSVQFGDSIDYVVERLYPGDIPGNQELREKAKQAMIDGNGYNYIEVFCDAIEKDYVTVPNYLQKALEIRVDNLIRLKTVYLD